MLELFVSVHKSQQAAGLEERTGTGLDTDTSAPP